MAVIKTTNTELRRLLQTPERFLTGSTVDVALLGC